MRKSRDFTSLPRLKAVLLPGSLFAIFLPTLYVLYSLALPGYLLYDDVPNLEGLEHVNDFTELVEFATLGQAGPLGRPIALLTFALQSDSWPHDTAAFLRANIAIHVANTCLVFFLATALALLRLPRGRQVAVWVGLLVAIFWGASPFLANTSLMIIQRMTSLSAFFVFLGLNAFVLAHLLRSQAYALRNSLLLLFSLCIPLAALSKENGVLLPAFAAVILLAWLPKDHRLTDVAGRLSYLFLVFVPTLIILGYAALQFPDILTNGYGPNRYFTPIERLMTQPWVMMDYVRNILVPNSLSASPFFDNWPAGTGIFAPPIIFFSLVFWAGLLVFVFWLRERAKWLIFAVAFFLIGHVVESTIFGLEIYFAHRNYVPAFGLFFGGVWASLAVTEKYYRVARLGAGAYAAVFVLILAQTTSGWANSFVSTLIWAQENPNSSRAVEFLVTHYSAMRAPVAAREVLDKLAERDPSRARVQILRTHFCVDDQEQFTELLEEVNMHLEGARLDQAASLELINLASHSVYRGGFCSARDLEAVSKMAEALLRNESYWDFPTTRGHLFFVLALDREAAGQGQEAVKLGVKAFRASGDLYIGLYTSELLAKMGDFEEWDAWVTEIKARAPNTRRARDRWLQSVDEHRRSVNAGDS